MPTQPNLSAAAGARSRIAAATAATRRRTRGERPQERGPTERLTSRTGMPVLVTKLTPPRMPFRLVSRPRLLAQLDAGAQQLLTLVSAAAGAGKTTLLTAWISSGRPPGPVAWVSLGPGEDQSARFWAYVLAALRRSGAVPADSPLRALAPGPRSDGTFLPLLVNGLARLPTPVVLILDDVQDLTDANVLGGLEFLLRNAPPQLRLVLSTRADPPLPLQRLLVSGQLAQVRSADLAFTVEEVAELLAAQEPQPRLSAEDIVLLRARTEGWAAGLRLAALSLRGQPDPHRFVTDLAGDDRSIADYLLKEVLNRQPEELRSFLLRTSIVQELNGHLADALTGGHDGEWMLARLERDNGFVMALKSHSGSYRYHELFAGLLRCQLRHEAPDQIHGLHRRAAAWYAEQGLVVSAIQQAFMAEDWHYAADLVLEHGLSPILGSEAATFPHLIDRLPAELLRTDPELALLAAADGIVREDPETAMVYLRLAERRGELLDRDRQDRFSLLLAICRSALAWQVGDLDEVMAAGHQALALQARAVAGGTDDTLAVTLSNLGTAELWAGDLDAAETHLQEAQTVATRAGLGSLQLTCMSQLAVLRAMRGALAQAARLGESAVELAKRRGWSTSAQTAGAHLALAWAHYQRDELVEADRHLERAAAVSRLRLERPLMLAVAMLRARLQRARGDLAGALATVASARQDLTGWRPPAHLWRWLVLTEAELHSASGQPQSASSLLEGLDESQPLGTGEAVVLARLQLAEGNPAGAAASIASCLDATASRGLLVAPVEAWLLDALASDALADRDRAAASLERALTLAEHDGFRRSFLDAGARGRSLLVRYRHRMPTSWTFLDELLEASAESVPTPAPPPTLIDRLTERERTVLRYLPSLMTYDDIASDLYVSPNTVKTHVNGIFRKLGVSGRRQAVRIARELQLI
jgi:LuxR family transcriptional regulator, maltose regulon positive regulatory protein